MKKIIISAFACCLIFSVMFAVSCNKQTQLDIPQNLRVDTDDYLRWDEVKNAEYYLVNIDGKEYRVKTNEIDLFDKCIEKKNYPIKVRAVGKNDVSPSDSAAIDYDLNYSGAIGYKNAADGSGYVITVVDKEKLPQKVIIPSEIKGTPVVAIIARAFWKCETITSVYIPDSVKNIYDNAFSSCKNLERVRLPSFLDSIKNALFLGCEKLKEIELPNGIKSISNSAFKSCKSLKEIVIPESVTSIALSAFGGCNLKQLRIPKFVDSMKPYGINADEVIVDSENKTYYSVDNCILTRKDNVLFSGGKNGIIPEIVSVIGEKAFYATDKERIDIPGHIKTISNEAFRAAKIQEAYIENGVEEILSGAFRSSRLKKITIPESVAKIEDGSVLSHCFDLEEIVISAQNKTFYAEDGYILTKKENSIVTGNTDKPFPQSAKEIGWKVFANNEKIESVVIPANITRVGKGAFANCVNLKQVVFEGGGIIESNAFSDCENLISVYFSKNVKSIDQMAFNGCYNFHSATLADDTVLDEMLFANTAWLTVFYPKSIDTSKVVGEMRYSMLQSEIGYDGVFPYVKSVTPITIDSNGQKDVLEYAGHTMEVPERIGYDFKGWSKNEDCSTIDYPFRIREAFTGDGWYPVDFLESYYTNSPFVKDLYGYYDPDIKTLYAVWEKSQ